MDWGIVGIGRSLKIINTSQSEIAVLSCLSAIWLPNKIIESILSKPIFLSIKMMRFLIYSLDLLFK